MDEDVRERLRAGFAANPAEAFRLFFHLQEQLKEARRDEDARLLAEDLWALLAGLSFSGGRERARFLHNFAVFLGSPGPAADLARSRELFARALGGWGAAEDAADVARARHNEGNALQNLGTRAEELAEAVALYERALVYRTGERAIARGVTLHNLGAALRKLALLSEPPGPLLVRSEEALLESIEIREAEGLLEGLASSWFQLGLTLEAAADTGRVGAAAAARAAFEAAEAAYDSAGKPDQARVAGRCALDVGGG